MFLFFIFFVFSQACKLKLGDFKGALLDADFAIREREGHAKAYFRQGQVLRFLLMLCF
jgi:peptidyl-prolyl isomerase D